MSTLKGQLGSASGYTPPGFAVWGDAGMYGWGVVGSSNYSVGVLGHSNSFFGVVGDSDGTGVFGSSNDFAGVLGMSNNGQGVVGDAHEHEGVVGRSESEAGVAGISEAAAGVRGESTGAEGVLGFSEENDAVCGWKSGTAGNAGFFSNFGLKRAGDRLVLMYGMAATFVGHVNIHGWLTVSGGKAFRIDHPLEPAGKWLQHSCVESPDMKTFYDGIATLDDTGECEVVLSEWFEALNGELRYQLTSIGAPAPGLHVRDEVRRNRFRIAGGVPGSRVSWQVTGVRKDPWAASNRLRVEEQKARADRGRYVHPQYYGKSRPATAVLLDDLARKLERFQGRAAAGPRRRADAIRRRYLSQVTRVRKAIAAGVGRRLGRHTAKPSR